jgi:hypothetical protein
MGLHEPDIDGFDSGSGKSRESRARVAVIYKF